MTETGSQTPKLVCIALLMISIAAGLSFQFKVEAAQLRDRVACMVSSAIRSETPPPLSRPDPRPAGEPDIPAPEERGPEPTEMPVPQEAPARPSKADQGRILLGDALWYEETGNIKTAQKKYRECIRLYPDTDAAKKAEKFLDYCLEQAKPIEPLPPSAGPVPEFIPVAQTEADQLYRKAMQHMRKAFTYPPSRPRNREFRKAEVLFRKALDLYLPLYEKHKTSELELRIMKVQEQLYSSLRLRTI